SQYFFFSSRRRPTSFSRDWSSDVCSSDLSISPCRDRWRASPRKRRAGWRRAPCPPLAWEAAAKRWAPAPIVAAAASAAPAAPGQIGRASGQERVSGAVGDGVLGSVDE